MNRKRAIWTAVLAGVAAWAWGQDVTVRMGVEPRLVELGETATLTIAFEGMSGNAPQVELPQVEGVRMGGPMTSSQTSIVNGHASSQVQLQWTLFPTRTGDIVLGPWDLDVDGKTLAFPRMVLAVKERGDGAAGSGDALFARVGVPEKPPYIGEDFAVDLEVWSAPEIALDGNVRILGGLPESGFQSGGYAGLRPTREERNGRVYVVQRYRGTWRALTTGTFEFAPVVRVTVLRRNERRRDFFDPFGMGDPFGRIGTAVDLPAEPASLEVRPTPEEGRPAEWSGGVGRYRFEAVARPREVRVGEPVTVTATLRGEGDLETPRMPRYNDTPAYKAYEPKLAGGGEDGAKVYDQVVIPRSEALMELPALEFCWFDPVAEEYRTATAGPFPLKVLPAEGGDRALVLSSDGAAGAAKGAGATLLDRDIQYLHEVPARAGRGGGAGRGGWGWWAARGAAAAGLGALWAARRRRERLSSDVALARRLKAPRASRAHLRRAEAAVRRGAGAAEVFGELAGAVEEYFGHRLNWGAGDATAGRILGWLAENGADEATVGAFREFFEVADRVRYGAGGGGGTSAEGWPEKVAAALRQAERVRARK